MLETDINLRKLTKKIDMQRRLFQCYKLLLSGVTVACIRPSKLLMIDLITTLEKTPFFVTLGYFL